MIQVRRPQRFDWIRVLVVAGALAAVGSSVVSYPMLHARFEQAQQRRLRDAYAGGLQPCSEEDGPIELLVQTYLPERPDLSIEEYPSLVSQRRLIRLVGERAYLLEFDAVREDTKATGRPRWIADTPPHITSAALSATTRSELEALFASDIRHAQALDADVLDGVAYVYRVPGIGCGFTNSPAPETRAGKLTHLYFLIGLHAKLTEREAIEQSDREIGLWAKAMRVDE